MRIVAPGISHSNFDRNSLGSINNSNLQHDDTGVIIEYIFRSLTDEGNWPSLLQAIEG
jgi:hypothetical protein